MLDGSAYSRTKDIPDQLRGRIRLACGNLLLLDEKVVCLKQITAVVFIHRAMNLVGAALGDEADLRTR